MVCEVIRLNTAQKKVLTVMALFALFCSVAAAVLPAVLTPPDKVFSVTDWSYSDIISVTIYNGEARLDFVRDGDQWRLGDDADFDLDQDRAVAVVNHCRYLSIREMVQDSQDAAAFGLDNPSYSVEVTLSGGAIKIFDIGAQTVDTKGRFARERGSAQIFIINEASDRIFTLGKQALVNRRPAGIDMFGALSVHIRAAGKYEVHMARADATLPMMMDAPAKGYVNPQAFEDIASRITRLMFDEPVAIVREVSELEAYGLSEPSLIMTAGDGKAQFGIMLGAATPDGQGMYGMRMEKPDTVFTISNDKVDWLFSKSDFSFVSSYVFFGSEQYATEEFEDIEIICAAESQNLFAVKPSGEAFSFTLNGQPFPEEKAQRIVTSLLDMKLAGVCDAAKAGSEPAVTIEARMSGLLVTKCVFYPYDSQFYAVDQGLGVYYLARAEDVDAFVKLFL